MNAPIDVIKSAMIKVCDKLLKGTDINEKMLIVYTAVDGSDRPFGNKSFAI